MNKENMLIPSKILKKVSDIELFSSSMKKLTLSEKLENNEKEFILTVALFFLQEYSKDKRRRQYREFAYYIILKYSTLHNDFKPLYDISVVLWFYPISNFILQKNLLPKENFQDFIIEQELKDFEYNNYIETYEQYMSRENILKNISEYNNISYIAPTSYGKNSIIIEIIKQNYIWKNIWIIVPTKSLLAQVHKDIQKEGFNTKILTYDRMLDENTESFIAIFTQERALRLLAKENNISFDILFIDEAHNIFKNDSRNHLLARLLSLNSHKNKNAINIFLSPYVENSNNFLPKNTKNLIEKRVNFSMKELEIYEYTSNHDIYKYNRFLFPNNKQWYLIGNIPDFRIYIRENSWNKNFIYHGTPYRVEEIARDFYWIWEKINPSDKLKKLIDFLKNEVDEEFYIVELLEKWIIYIHWWLPDMIKEYLEYSFKTIKEITYLVANSVILEWINLPIDTIFILESHWLLQNNKLINLVGRANRLNQIFDNENWNLEKLLPKIHFVTTKFQREKQNFKNLIQSLSKQVIKDKIENPLLANFSTKKIKDRKKLKEIELLQKYEKILYQYNISDEFLKLKKYIIENSINIFYKQAELDKIIKNIEKRINSNNFNNLSIINKIYIIFIIDNIEYTINKTLKSFENENLRWFFDRMILDFSKKSLKENILNTYIHLKGRQDKWEPLYINNQFFEPKENKKFSEKELKNLAIIQVKANSDFISFTLNKFITFLKDYKLITEQEYNEIYYWKIDEKYIKFIDSWLSKWILQKIIKDNQIHNLWIDKFWNIIWDNNFKIYKEALSDFEQFQINKIIKIKK